MWKVICSGLNISLNCLGITLQSIFDLLQVLHYNTSTDCCFIMHLGTRLCLLHCSYTLTFSHRPSTWLSVGEQNVKDLFLRTRMAWLFHFPLVLSSDTVPVQVHLLVLQCFTVISDPIRDPGNFLLVPPQYTPLLYWAKGQLPPWTPGGALLGPRIVVPPVGSLCTAAVISSRSNSFIPLFLHQCWVDSCCKCLPKSVSVVDFCFVLFCFSSLSGSNVWILAGLASKAKEFWERSRSYSYIGSAVKSWELQFSHLTW